MELPPIETGIMQLSRYRRFALEGIAESSQGEGITDGAVVVILPVSEDLMCDDVKFAEWWPDLEAAVRAKAEQAATASFLAGRYEIRAYIGAPMPMGDEQ